MPGAQPRVSVLMAVYNAERFVERAVASVLAQTLTDFELVAVDDGSTDESPAILRRLAAQDARIVLHHQANRGIGGAMNQALALARAPLVAILDSDDLMLPTRLSTQVAWMDAHPEVAAAGSQFHTIDIEDRTTGLDRHPIDPALATPLMFGYFCLHHPTVIARRSALVAAGGYEETHRRGSPDYGLFMKLVLAGHRLANLPQVLTAWRHTPTGATFGHAREQTADALAIRAHGFSHLQMREPETAAAVSLLLAQRFGAGTELDEKARWLGLAEGPQPAVQACLDRPGTTGLPVLDEAALHWLNNGAAADFAAELVRAGHSWLARLLAARTEGMMDSDAAQAPLAWSRRVQPGLLSLLLVVDTPPDDEASARIDTLAAGLPANAELRMFAPEPDVARAWSHSPPHELRMMPLTAADPAQRWLEALQGIDGEYLAVLEWTGAHAPGFLSEARALLKATPELDLVHASSALFFPDALGDDGEPLPDPAPEPRWTRETLLGRRRIRLQDLVMRRSALASLPLCLRECGGALPHLLAHALLLTGHGAALPLRNRAMAPPAGLGASPAELAIERLVHGYLDAVEGLVPCREAWPALESGRRRSILALLDARARQHGLPVHAGNVRLLLDFILHGTSSPLAHPSLRRLLRSHPGPTLEALRQQGAIHHACALGWSWLQRLGGKLQMGAA